MFRPITIIKAKIKRAFLFFLSLVLPLLNPLDEARADISGLFVPSLPHISSGFYTWSTWDYLTTPYIYPLLKKNAVSSIVTDKIFSGSTNQKLSFALKYSIPIPSFEIPLFFAFSLENTGTSTERFTVTPNPAAIKIDRTNAPFHQFVFGTSYGNFGLGFIVQNGRSTAQELYANEGNTEKAFRYPQSSSDELIKRFDGYGFEFGYINAANPSEGYALTMGLIYKQYGGGSTTKNPEGELTSFENRPFMKLELQQGTITSIGSQRNEVELNLLGWYHITKVLNVGASFKGYLPFASGYKVGSTGADAEPFTEEEKEQEKNLRSTVLSGSFVNPVLFMDIDFAIETDIYDTGVAGYFRVSPAVNYWRHTETLTENRGSDTEEDPKTQRAFSRTEEFLAFDLSVRLAVAMGKDKSFEIYLGYTPSLIIYEKNKGFFDANANGEFDDGDDEEGGTPATLGRLNVVSSGGSKYSTGFSYRPYESLAVHVNFTLADQLVNLSRVNVGADFLF